MDLGRTYWSRELVSPKVSLSYSTELGSAMPVPDREVDENIVFSVEMPSNGV